VITVHRRPTGRRLLEHTLSPKFTVALVLVGIVGMLGASPAAAEPTRIEVRVLSKGAKFVGTSMGGVLVTIRDAETGELLARGVTQGGTGDTQRIMKSPLPHHEPVSTADAAVYRASIELAEPRLLEVSALGPLAQRQSANRVSSTMWSFRGDTSSAATAGG
jgi:hypothetical protein